MKFSDSKAFSLLLHMKYLVVAATRKVLGLGVMSQLVKVPFEHEDPSLDPYHHVKSWMRWYAPIILLGRLDPIG